MTFFAWFIMMKETSDAVIGGKLMYSVELRQSLYTKRPLRFGPDGKFRILMVSDIHGGV